MFVKRDAEMIDREYFEVLCSSCYHIILISKNTRHYWDIYSSEVKYGKLTLCVYHKHKSEYPFHLQKGFRPKNVEEAQDLIKSHDEFHIKRQEKKRQKRRA